MTEIECVVHGRVQGVGYRDHVATAATQCNVFGWVKNETDGTVRLCAQGTIQSLKDFIEYLHEGSVSSRVEQVSVEYRSAQTNFDDFSVC